MCVCVGVCVNKLWWNLFPSSALSHLFRTLRFINSEKKQNQNRLSASFRFLSFTVSKCVNPNRVINNPGHMTVVVLMGKTRQGLLKIYIQSNIDIHKHLHMKMFTLNVVIWEMKHLCSRKIILEGVVWCSSRQVDSFLPTARHEKMKLICMLAKTVKSTYCTVKHSTSSLRDIPNLTVACLHILVFTY